MKTRTTLYILVALAALLAVGCDGNLLLASRGTGTKAQTEAVSTPVFSPAPDIYDSDCSAVLSSATSGAEIYYTITKNGAVPPDPTATTGTPYAAPIQIAGDPTSATIWRVKAIAVKPGMDDSPVTSGTFTIDYGAFSTTQVAAPSLSLASGSYILDQTVSISCASGATVYYTMTTDGSVPPDPTTSSIKYVAAISVAGNSANVHIKAIAAKSGMTSSTIASGAFTVSYPNSITVSLNHLLATPVVFSGNSATVQKGTNMAVTTTFTATSYAWYLDFSAVPASTASSYTVATSALGYGMHTLALVVVSGGISYSGSFSFQVTQ